MLSTKKNSRGHKSSATKLSCHIIAANDDLLIEVLIRLPIKSLLRFKSVSKHWLSLITNPQFCHRKNQSFSKAIPGLLLRRSSLFMNPEYDLIPLDDSATSPFKYLTFDKSLTFDKPPYCGIKVLQSCNGLLLCRSFRAEYSSDCKYYIFNPTTKQFITIRVSIPRVSLSEEVKDVYAVNLAFDPRKSQHYKLVIVYFSRLAEDHFEIEVYSSETGLRRFIGDPFQAEVNFQLGVYWNGAINWISYCNDGLYFKLDEERLGSLPMPPLPDGWEEEGRRIRYFGESNDHLHLIQIYGPPTIEFNVYEMDRDYSGWFVKFRVDLEPVVSSFPEMICHELDPSSLHYYRFLILDVVRKSDDEGSFLVLSIPGKAVRFKFEDNSAEKLCDFVPDRNFGVPPMYGWYDSFQFMESLYPL